MAYDKTRPAWMQAANAAPEEERGAKPIIIKRSQQASVSKIANHVQPQD